MILQIGDGYIVAKSDNMSTLAIIKDCITQDASQRKIVVSIEETELVNSLNHVLEILHPLVQK